MLLIHNHLYHIYLLSNSTKREGAEEVEDSGQAAEALGAHFD